MKTKIISLSVYYCLLKIVFLQNIVIAFYDEDTINKGDRQDLKIMKLIIKNFFCNKYQHTILFGNWSNEETLFFNRNAAPVLLIDIDDIDNSETESVFQNHERFEKVYKLNETIVSKNNYPVNNVFMTTTSYSSVMDVLTRFKHSIWWNHEAFFLLMNTNSENGCQQALSFLYLMWMFKMTSVIYLCHDLDKKLMLFTYNPYSFIASIFWNVTKSSISQNGNWTLLEHKVNDLIDPLLYNRMNFDKTKNLLGYNLKSSVHVGSKFIRFDTTKNHLKSLIGKYPDVIRIVLTYINATVTIKLYDFGGFVEKNGQPQGVLKDQEQESTDFILPAMYLRDYWKMQSYPFEVDGFCIASLTRPIKYVDKFMSIFSIDICFFVILNVLISVIFLKYFLRQTICTANLECMRIFVGSRYNAQLRSSSEKVGLLTLIFFQFLTSSYILSYLSSVNTIPDRSPTINSFEDLFKSNLPICGLKSHKDVIPKVKVENRYHGVKDLSKCTEQLLANKDIACVSSCFRIKLFVQEDDYIHISKNGLGGYLTFSLAPDWPLLSKFNSVLQKVVEMGVIDLLSERHLRFFSKIRNNIRKTPKPINISNVMFNFWILIGGWILATVFFFLELLVTASKSMLKH